MLRREIGGNELPVWNLNLCGLDLRGRSVRLYRQRLATKVLAAASTTPADWRTKAADPGKVIGRLVDCSTVRFCDRGSPE